jgi:hypothetical protein
MMTPQLVKMKENIMRLEVELTPWKTDDSVDAKTVSAAIREKIHQLQSWALDILKEQDKEPKAPRAFCLDGAEDFFAEEVAALRCATVPRVATDGGPGARSTHFVCHHGKNPTKCRDCKRAQRQVDRSPCRLASTSVNRLASTSVNRLASTSVKRALRGPFFGYLFLRPDIIGLLRRR